MCAVLADKNQYYDLNINQTYFYFAAYKMMRWGVPVFFMITGALLLNPDKKITVGQCIKKYCLRSLTALLLFGIPYAFLKVMVEYHGFQFRYVFYALKAVLENNGSAHMWYIYTLIGIYLVLPLLKLFVEHAKMEDVKFVLIVLGFIDFFIPLISALTGIEIAFNLPLKYPIFYMFTGYYINKEKEKIKRFRNIFLPVIVGCVLFIWFINYAELQRDIWTAYDSPLVAILAIVVFLEFITKEYPFSQQLWNIDRLCFGVYLIHPALIQLCFHFLKITPARYGAYPVITVLFFVTFVVCSFTGSWIMNKIKPLRKYVL